MTQINDRT